MYKTKDMFGAVTLRTLGYSIAETSDHHKGYVTFTFNISSELANEIIKDYWDKKISVDAKTFVECINEIKTRIHNNKNGN